jgi:hypothetical protein
MILAHHYIPHHDAQATVFTAYRERISMALSIPNATSNLTMANSFYVS